MINIFILCTEVIIEHIFVGFIQTMVVFIKKSNKKLIFPTMRLLNIAPCVERVNEHSDIIPIGKPYV